MARGKAGDEFNTHGVLLDVPDLQANTAFPSDNTVGRNDMHGREASDGYRHMNLYCMY